MNTSPDYRNFYYPPGGILIWIIILVELLTFGAALVGLAVVSREDPASYHRSRLLLHPFYGALNTVFLLTSGYFMAMSVHWAKQNRWKKSAKQIPWALLGGFLFVVLKSVEYYEKWVAGLTLGYDTFFNFYWLLTGFHVVHVLIGLGILAGMYAGIKRKGEAFQLTDLEAGAHFWHMVDLIWLLLFPMLYLIL